jgi:signal transduction histidine kinase
VLWKGTKSVSNVIHFPRRPRDAVAHPLLAASPPNTHAVQFYEDPAALFQTVGTFVSAGLEADECVVIIATAAHREGFLAQLDEAVVDAARASGQLTLLDAHETLARFMVGGMPDPDLFREVLNQLVARLRATTPTQRVRAFGEMVDVLWRGHNAKAAIRLEELWELAVKEHSLSLLCAYVMGNFYREGDAAHFIEVCSNHSHVFPTEQFVELDDPDARLREISLLQQRAKALENEVLHRKELEVALREALRDRSRVEEALRLSVKREQDARAKAEQNDAFKEEFVGILGHDLRNPLNTILTTARLMTMRKELPPESHKRLERVVLSGVRMQRMIEQILDVTRDRLSSGIPVDRQPEQDIVALVTSIVDEIRLAHPTRLIELHTSGRCVASIDRDRIEQVVSNLVGNAIAHGDPEKPVLVEVSEQRPASSGGGVRKTIDAVCIGVHNHGPPIDASFVPLLFDPFRRARKAAGPSDGLGLGLYISHRIVRAHEGTITVESSADAGTRFQVTLPRAS